MTPNDVARHARNARHLPPDDDDDAPPARWWCLGLVFAGCVGWLAVVGLVAMAMRRVWE